jgi:hypothetical protein
MTARFFWTLGVGLALLALWLLVAGAVKAGGVIDYRPGLLMAFGVLSLAIGNFSRPSGHDS